MALTNTQLQALLTHALGKSPATGHVMLHTLNRAGRWLVTAHAWSWRHRVSTTFAAVASQAYIALPTTFGQVIDCIVNLSLVPTGFRQVEIVSLSHIADLRQRFSTLGDGVLYIAFPGYTQSDTATVHPIARAEVFPTPTANGDPTMELTFLQKWRELTSTGSDEANIPDDFENLLVLKSRLMALQVENPDGSWPDLRAELQEELARMVLEDESRQEEVGPLIGGAAARSRSNLGRHLIGTISL